MYRKLRDTFLILVSNQRKALFESSLRNIFMFSSFHPFKNVDVNINMTVPLKINLIKEFLFKSVFLKNVKSKLYLKCKVNL